MNDEHIRDALRRLAYAILDRTSQVEFDPITAIACVRQTLDLCEAEVNDRKAAKTAMLTGARH